MTSQEAAYRRHLEDAGHCRALSIAEASPEHMLAALAGIRTLPRNPLDQLAATLSSQLPELFTEFSPRTGITRA